MAPELIPAQLPFFLNFHSSIPNVKSFPKEVAYILGLPALCFADILLPTSEHCICPRQTGSNLDPTSLTMDIILFLSKHNLDSSFSTAAQRRPKNLFSSACPPCSISSVHSSCLFSRCLLGSQKLNNYHHNGARCRVIDFSLDNFSSLIFL